MILALQQHQPTTQTSTQTPTPEELEVKALKGFAKFCKGVADQLAAIYDPRLVAISDHGIIIGWVDSRTGEKPWFS